jgi:hypothetical protein
MYINAFKAFISYNESRNSMFPFSSRNAQLFRKGRLIWTSLLARPSFAYFSRLKYVLDKLKIN